MLYRTIRRLRAYGTRLTWLRDHKAVARASDGLLRRPTQDHARPVALCHPNERLTHADVKRSNLELVTSLLDEHGAPYFVVRNTSPLRYRVGVEERHRPTVLRALRERFALDSVYVQVGRGGPNLPSVLVRGASPASLAEAEMLRVFRRYLVPGTNLEMAAPLGCEIEFWQHSGDTLLAPAANRITRQVPDEFAAASTVRIGGREHPSLEVFSEPNHIDEIDFPIDVVYTWVDHRDPEWRAKKEFYLRSAEDDDLRERSANDSRYYNRDELRYSLRSLELFTDFVRRIFIVTDSQVPGWLDTSHPKVSIVDHREIFDDHNKLPTFNSRAIESQLHRIPGLSEHFLYFNDDFFVGRPVTPSLFFLSNGLPRFFPATQQIQLGPPTLTDQPYMCGLKNNRALLQETFGVTVTQRIAHAPYALRKSILEEMEATYAKAFEATSRARFRSPTDISPASSLHPYYAYLTGRSIQGKIKTTHLNAVQADLQWAFEQLEQHRNVDAFCINDTNGTPTDLESSHRTIQRYLQLYFPLRSSFER